MHVTYNVCVGTGIYIQYVTVDDCKRYKIVENKDAKKSKGSDCQ